MHPFHWKQCSLAGTRIGRPQLHTHRPHAVAKAVEEDFRETTPRFANTSRNRRASPGSSSTTRTRVGSLPIWRSHRGGSFTTVNQK
jgi:hypothetical protein